MADATPRGGGGQRDSTPGSLEPIEFRVQETPEPRNHNFQSAVL